MSALYQPKTEWLKNSLVSNRPQAYSIHNLKIKDISEASLWHADWLKKYIIPEEVKLCDLEKICTLQMIHFMKYTEELERLLVSPVLNDVINGQYDYAIKTDSVGIKGAAIRILVDEAYHASFSFDAHHDMLQKLRLPTLSAIKKTKDIIESIKLGPTSNQPFRRMIVAVMSESNVTNDLAKISKNIKPGPFQDMILDHLRDEQSHMLFFDRLFSLFWGSLTEDSKEMYAKQIPELMFSYYKKDIGWLAENCNHLEVSYHTKKALTSYQHENLTSIINDQAKPFINLLRRNKVFANKNIAKAFDSFKLKYEQQ